MAVRLAKQQLGSNNIHIIHKKNVFLTSETPASNLPSISSKVPWSIRIASKSFRYRLRQLGFCLLCCLLCVISNTAEWWKHKKLFIVVYIFFRLISRKWEEKKRKKSLDEEESIKNHWYKRICQFRQTFRELDQLWRFCGIFLCG